MAPQRRCSLGKMRLFLLASVWAALASAIDVDICATFNTADSPKNVSIYQTNGLCHDFCISKFAFAITQDNGCWCSDYYPDSGSTEDSSKCNTPCPAFPAEDCGGQGLFGYIALNEVAPSGTKSASTPSSTSTDTPTVTPSTVKTTSTSSTTTSSSQSTSTTPAPPVIQTVTNDGTVKTVFLTPTETSASNDNDHNGVPMQKSGLSTGSVVGIVVGVISGVLLGAGAVAMFFLRRRRRQEELHEASLRGGSADMMGSVRPEMSMGRGSPPSPSSGNRNSALNIDPRMDPFKQGLYVRSGSHESLNTLRDDHDYSRRIQAPKVLRATNPDPMTEP